jgi:hypothetical protein
MTVRLWGIVRIDHSLENIPDVDQRGPTRLVTLTRLHHDEELASAEVVRLSALSGARDNEYFAIPTELHADPPGNQPIALVAVDGYVEGSRLLPSMVRLGGVWSSPESAVASGTDAEQSGWAVVTARIGRRTHVTR